MIYFGYLSNDVIFHIFSTYVYMPWLSKNINIVCNNNFMYINMKRKYKNKIIREFLSNLDSRYYFMLKDEIKYTYILDKFKNITRYQLELALKVYHDKDDYVWKLMSNYDLAYYENMYEGAYLENLKRKVGSKIVLSKEEYIRLLSFDGWFLKYIPRDMRTYDICEIALRNGGDLYDVDEEYKDFKLCETALKYGSCDFDCVPQLIDENEYLSDLILKNNPCYYMYGMDRKNIDYEILKKCVSGNGLSIEHIDCERITKELCNIAVSNTGESLYYIIEKEDEFNEDSDEFYDEHPFIDKEICKIAISNYPLAIHDTPEEFIDEEIAYFAVFKNYTCIEYIPDHIGSNEEFYKCNPSCAYYLGEEYIKRFIQEYSL